MSTDIATDEAVRQRDALAAVVVYVWVAVCEGSALDAPTITALMVDAGLVETYPASADDVARFPHLSLADGDLLVRATPLGLAALSGIRL